MRGGRDLGRGAQLAWGALLACGAAAVAACTAGGSTPLPPNTLTLTQVQWCDTPSIAFQDDGKLSHTVLTDWSAVKDQLDFTPYLPASLPKGTCLALAGGTIHDPIFGGLFRITYSLPGSRPIRFPPAPHSGAAAP